MLVEGAAIVSAGLDRARLKSKNKTTPPSTATETAARATHFQTFVEDFATIEGEADGEEITGPAGRVCPSGSAELLARRVSAGAAFSVSPARGKARSAFTEVWSCAR